LPLLRKGFPSGSPPDSPPFGCHLAAICSAA
jgi:hypothetical protein